ncbi:MAG: thermonuclease family protein [Bdellovibrionales bacterium]|nr:thermonuclease family protein [Bdellovibrionales bacterium]
MYSYFVEIVRVVDGDTIDVIVDLGFNITQKMRLRLKDIDTPEVRGKTRKEGLKSSAFVKDELSQAKLVAIRSYKVGKYGRYIAELFYSKRRIKPENIFKSKYSLNKILVKKRLAKVMITK